MTDLILVLMATAVVALLLGLVTGRVKLNGCCGAPPASRDLRMAPLPRESAQISPPD